MKRPNGNAEESLKTFLDSLGNAPQATIEASRDRLIERFRAGDQLPAFEVEETPRRGWSPWLMAAVAASLLAAVVGIVAFRDSPDSFVAVAENQAKIRIGEPVRSPSGMKLTLTDGSLLNMRPGSELSFYRAGYRAEGGLCIQLVRGDLVVNAAKQEAGHRLCVQAKDLIVTVIGTVFTVRVEERGSSVSVEEGTVWVQQGSTRKTLMAGGRFSTIAAEPEAAPQVSTLTATPSPQAPPQAQETAKPAPPQFDVVSIRKLPPGAFLRRDLGFYPGGFRAPASTLKELVLWVYDLKVSQVSGGPAWIDSDRFVVETIYGDDVRARMDAVSARLGSNFPRNSNDEEWKQLRSTLQSMVQDVLATRFKLKVRRTTEQASVYALVLDGETSKLQAGSESEGARSSGPNLQGSATMDILVLFLSRELGQPVVDRTGLPGLYNINLHFEREVDREERAARGNTPVTGGRGGGPISEYPGLPTALREQLGLKLETTKAAVPFLVIESVEQPSEN